MVRADKIILRGESPKAHGIYDDTVTDLDRELPCEVRSIGMNEMYTAKSQGLNPSFTFMLRNYREYYGEKIVIYQGVEYSVIRTYVNQNDGIEITVERSNHDI